MLGDLVAVGKVRYIGLCNETPWRMNHAHAPDLGACASIATPNRGQLRGIIMAYVALACRYPAQMALA